MSTLPVIPEVMPDYLKVLLAANPELALINEEALSGSARPLPPTIVADKGKFIKKVDGQETTIVYPDEERFKAAGIVGTPMTQLQAVVLKAKRRRARPRGRVGVVLVWFGGPEVGQRHGWAQYLP